MSPQNSYYCDVIPANAPKGDSISWTDTVGRRAVRQTRKETLKHGIGAKGNVRVQEAGSARRLLLHQCVVKRNGKLSWKGVEL